MKETVHYYDKNGVEISEAGYYQLQLRAAERDRDELRTLAEEQSKLAGSNAARAQKAEAELARRDAAAGEPVAWQYRYTDGKVGDWHTVDSESECNHHPFYERRPIYAASPPAVLPHEMLPENTLEIETLHGVKLSQMQRAIAADAYNQCRADALALGAQPQKVVELPNVYTWSNSEVVYLAALKQALDAAGVKWEVKK